MNSQYNGLLTDIVTNVLGASLVAMFVGAGLFHWVGLSISILPLYFGILAFAVGIFMWVSNLSIHLLGVAAFLLMFLSTPYTMSFLVLIFILSAVFDALTGFDSPE